MLRDPVLSLAQDTYDEVTRAMKELVDCAVEARNLAMCVAAIAVR